MSILETLSQKRPVFCSEADFQFAFAWEIQSYYKGAAIRLEYPTRTNASQHVDIMVRLGHEIYPIELKYKTASFAAGLDNGETISVKNHGAQDLGKYDFVGDICRLECFRRTIGGFREGYAVWLTNDRQYWHSPRYDTAGYYPFSVHEGAIKHGSMSWGSTMHSGSIKGRERPLNLSGSYLIRWSQYSRIASDNGLFMYSVISVPAEPPARSMSDIA